MKLIQLGYDFSMWTHFITESEIRRLLKYKVRYYFGGGKPGAIPIKTFAKILVELGERQIDDIMRGDALKVINEYNYGPTQGLESFRRVLAERLKRVDKLDVEADSILVTTGSQQALYALLDVLLDPGDTIITTAPAYLGFLTPAEKLGGQVICVPTDDKGIIPEYVEEAVDMVEHNFGKSPDIIYVVADSDNPKGTTLPTDRRRKLFEIAESRKILIVEDAAYREIQFEPVRYPAIKSFDKENTTVAYLRTTSKEAAVFRVGYSVMPPDIRDQVIKAKGFFDLCTPNILQEILTIYYSKYMDQALLNIIPVYKARRDAMIDAIEEYFPDGEFTRPLGGFFVWWEASNKDFDSKKFLEKVAIPNDILYVPGAAFYPKKGLLYNPEKRSFDRLKVPHNNMRLNFSFPSVEDIQEGIKKLGILLKDYV